MRNYEEELIKSILDEDVLSAILLMDKVENINYENIYSGTALTIICEKNLSGLLSPLLKKNPDVNLTSGYEWTPLHLAICNNNLTMVRNLIEAGAHVNDLSANMYTSIELASLTDYNMVEYLFSVGAHPYGIYESPISNSCTLKDLRMTKHLIEMGVDVHYTNPLGENCLYNAICNDSMDIFNYMILQNVDVKLSNKSGNTILHHYLRNILVADPVVVNTCLSSGVPIDAVNAMNLTAYDVAKNRYHPENILSMLKT